MNAPLLRALIALLPASILFISALALFSHIRSVSASLQVAGSGCLVIVALCHVFEAVDVFPWMGWGLDHSVGHYLDLSSAVLGLTLFPIGYLLHAFAQRRKNDDHGDGGVEKS